MLRLTVPIKRTQLLWSALRFGEQVTPTLPVLSVVHRLCFKSVSKVDFQQRSIHSSSRVSGLFGEPQEDGILKRMAKKMGWTETSKSTLRAYGYLLYIKTADGIDQKGFFKHCQLEDAFVSWFMCVELHVWMLSARLMEEGEEGKIVRNALMKAMWEDSDAKSKQLEGAVASARRKQIQVLSEEFQASLLSYDEGLLGNDKILAGALWRRFLRKNESNPKLSQGDLYNQLVALEMLVIYVRSQYYNLNQLSREKLLKRKFNWLTFDSKLYELAEKSNRRQAVA